MSLAAAVRIIAVAAVFVAAPAVADNSYWDPRQSRFTGFYANTPLEECQRSARGDLELRACLSRLLLEAESAYDIHHDLLIDIVANRSDQFVQAEEAEALRFARETWRQYLDFQCDFEGAMLGATYSERSLEATSCRVSLLRQQTARLYELLAKIDPNARPGGGSGGGLPFPSGAEQFRDWTVECRGSTCSAFTIAGISGREDHRLELVTRSASEHAIIFTSNTHPVDASRAITVRVDGGAPVVFRPYSGYQVEDGVFVLSETRAVSTLIRAMRRGGRLTVGYVDTSRQDRLATFSLYGVTNSLDWIEARRSGFPGGPTGPGGLPPRY